MLTMQEALARLTSYWTGQGCLTVPPMNTEVGAGTLNPATFLRVLGPEPWRVVYPEPSVRPDDSRYGENPNRVQTHTQLQVILKPEPGDAQELYLGSLAALGIDVAAHDVRFVEDNWAAPAVGAWGLGWEVWLDGLEITQFTYMQQAGGRTLTPPAVEITYGVERILMALQGVRHVKDIAYAKGVSYGEIFFPAEYEMSRYYLDDADLDTNRRLLDLYAGEAQRMIDAGLPVPAHTFVLKCSHLFNVLDARGAVSTADRAAEFARMRRLAGDVARLWVDRRAELGHPLGVWTPPVAPRPGPVADGTRPRMLALEIGTEEMPPGVAPAALAQVRERLTGLLGETRLTYGDIRVAATPRRLIALVADVAPREEDRSVLVRGPRLDAPARAVEGFARSHGVSAADLDRGATHYAVERFEAGRPAGAVLAEVLAEVVRGLRASRNMRWSDPELSFSRPIRWLLALLGDDVVPVTAGSLAAGRETRVLRDAEQPVISIASAETFMEEVSVRGIVADAEDREELIVTGARDLVYPDGRVDVDDLIAELTYLVEAPNPLLGAFDESYLALPAEVLTTVMRKHQRYLPVRDEDGALLPLFVAVANGVVDVEAVRAGNEAVLRARFADAAFFYRADRETPLPVLRERLERITFTEKLGSMADRAARIAALATGWSGDPTLRRAAELVKIDLGAHLVTEMTGLAGVMARDYLRHAGESRAVAQAAGECELPRSAGGELPRSAAGALLSVADRLDLLTGLAATVGLPTGSSDPYAMRRAALGVLAVLRAHPGLPVPPLPEALAQAAAGQPVPAGPEVVAAAAAFLTRRLEQQLVEEGNPVDRVRAVLPHADRPARAELFLRQLTELADDPRFRAVAAAFARARRIVPPALTSPSPDSPSPSPTPASPSPSPTPASPSPGHAFASPLLVLPAERALIDALVALPDIPDLSVLVETTDNLIMTVDRFFDEVLVMADDPALRAARLTLLATVRDLGDGLLDWAALRH